MVSQNAVRIIVFVSLVLTAQAQAASLTLFEFGQPVRNYNQILSSIEAGDHLLLSTRTENFEFKIRRIIHNPKTPSRISQNALFETPVGILRIPADPIHRESISDFVNGHRELEEMSLVDFRIMDFEPGLYVLHKKLDIKFTLAEFLISDWGPRYNGEPIALLKKRLREFALKYSRFVELGDFDLYQVGWVQDKWVLFDFGLPNTTTQENADPDLKYETLFSPYAKLGTLSILGPKGKQFARELHQLILNNRARESQCSMLVEETQSDFNFSTKSDVDLPSTN